MKIDAFCHIMPRPYFDRFFELDVAVHAANLRKRVSDIPSLADMDVRFAQMDELPSTAPRTAGPARRPAWPGPPAGPDRLAALATGHLPDHLIDHVTST